MDGLGSKDPLNSKSQWRSLILADKSPNIWYLETFKWNPILLGALSKKVFGDICWNL